ncbi:hypothetical protein ABVK25_010714 [Lepraria finkii]|uniref:Uncharacterized protein n=1 Tax=Lepraria finkii TaxID=1340010 RepID=A0ABR4AZW0_9LECA
MPGKQLGASTEAAPSPNFGSLKGHKPFPRRTHVVSETISTRSIGQEHKIRRKSDQIAYSSAERIHSWIPEPSTNPVIPVVGRPLTPPINFRDDFQSWIGDAELRDHTSSKKPSSDSSGTTPLVRQSPLTPETTPPRNTHRTRARVSLSSSHNPSKNRTDSFTTAKENQSSDDESHRIDSPSLHPARQNWLRVTGLAKHKDVGLGLGLESEDEESTAKDMTSRHSPKHSPNHSPRRSSKHEDFVTFDGSWGAEVDDALDNVSKKHQGLVLSKGRLQKRPRIASQTPQDSPTPSQDADAPLERSPSLRERVERNRGSSPNASTEKFAEQINWPLKDDQLDLDAELRGMNDKRMSQASTTSTIVEAMVINSPPRRRQTLRHTGKMIDLNSTDSPTHQSNRDSSISHDQSVRHRLRKSKSPDQELRKSFASDSPEIISPTIVKRRQDYTPVIVTPDRQSSLHSTASGSKRLSRTFSLNSRLQSSRPTTAPEDGVGYFDIPRRERRTLSVVIHSATPVKREDMAEKELPSSALAKTSPTSVPASTEPSTTTSVTSGGLHTLFSPKTPTDQQQATVQLTDVQDAHNLSLEVPTSGEWSTIRPRSTLVTPFSLRSAHSSTPGTFEVNEATAIGIYPHTNKSILVIQEMAGGGDSSRPSHHSAIIAGNANIELPGPVPPVILHESPPRELLHSPLKNPRDPPQPPDFKVIPPTPANAPLSSEDVRSAPRTSTRTNRFSAPMTSLKRAFSARRPHSESIITPFTRTFSLRGTASAPRPRPQTAEDRESKLHPFWKPRGFWDDVDGSDSESEFGNMGVPGSRVNSQSSRDIPPRRTMSLTRRLTGSLRMPHPPRRQRRVSVAGGLYQSNYEFFHPNTHNEEIKADPIPRQGYHVQSIGFRGLADKLERRREAKEEGKREERRNWLRDRIDLVGNGEVGGAAGGQENW